MSRRLFELTQAAAAAHEISIASVCKELDEAIALAKSRGQANALINAAGLRAKLGGLLVDKQQVEISNVDPFEEATSPAEVLAKVIEHCGVEAARALAIAFKIEFDEAAIEAVNTTANGNAVNSIEWQPPRPNRRRQIG